MTLISDTLYFQEKVIIMFVLLLLLLLLLLGVNHSADQVYNVLSKLGIMVRATTTVFPYVFENYLDM